MFQNFIAVCKSSTEMKRGSDFYKFGPLFYWSFSENKPPVLLGEEKTL